MKRGTRSERRKTERDGAGGNGVRRKWRRWSEVGETEYTVLQEEQEETA